MEDCQLRQLVMAGGGLGTAIATSFVPEFIEFQKFRAIVIMWVAAELAWYAYPAPSHQLPNIDRALCDNYSDAAITIALSWHLVRLSGV